MIDFQVSVNHKLSLDPFSDVYLVGKYPLYMTPLYCKLDILPTD